MEKVASPNDSPWYKQSSEPVKISYRRASSLG